MSELDLAVIRAEAIEDGPDLDVMFALMDEIVRLRADVEDHF